VIDDQSAPAALECLALATSIVTKTEAQIDPAHLQSAWPHVGITVTSAEACRARVGFTLPGFTGSLLTRQLFTYPTLSAFLSLRVLWGRAPIRYFHNDANGGRFREATCAVRDLGPRKRSVFVAYLKNIQGEV